MISTLEENEERLIKKAKRLHCLSAIFAPIGLLMAFIGIGLLFIGNATIRKIDFTNGVQQIDTVNTKDSIIVSRIIHDTIYVERKVTTNMAPLNPKPVVANIEVYTKTVYIPGDGSKTDSGKTHKIRVREETIINNGDGTRSYLDKDGDIVTEDTTSKKIISRMPAAQR